MYRPRLANPQENWDDFEQLRSLLLELPEKNQDGSVNVLEAKLKITRGLIEVRTPRIFERPSVIDQGPQVIVQLHDDKLILKRLQPQQDGSLPGDFFWNLSKYFLMGTVIGASGVALAAFIISVRMFFYLFYQRRNLRAARA